MNMQNMFKERIYVNQLISDQSESGYFNESAQC